MCGYLYMYMYMYMYMYVSRSLGPGLMVGFPRHVVQLLQADGIVRGPTCEKRCARNGIATTATTATTPSAPMVQENHENDRQL